MAKYTKCPNCSRKPGMFNHITIWRCRDCNKRYCRACGGQKESCPSCGSGKKTKDGIAN